MAKIVLGLGTSHTPMLLADDQTLQRFVETDQKIKHRDKEGRPITYGELVEKADPKMAHLVAPANLVARQNVARGAIKRVAQTLANSDLDALIVMGDDQNESYKEDCRPAFAIYYGDTIRNSNEQHEEYHKRFPEWYVQNRQGFFEDQGPRDYPVHAKLADPPPRVADGRGLRHGRVEVPARGRRRRPCHRLCASPGDGRAEAGRRGADLPQHLFPAQPAAAASAATNSARRCARRWRRSPATSASACWRPAA